MCVCVFVCVCVCERDCMYRHMHVYMMSVRGTQTQVYLGAFVYLWVVGVNFVVLDGGWGPVHTVCSQDNVL
jgi:hypothetical protein